MFVILALNLTIISDLASDENRYSARDRDFALGR